jgi:hypothetical protein
MRSGIDFARLYDEHPQHRARRDTGSLQHRLYQIEIHKWKIPNLYAVLPKGFQYASVAEVGCATGDIIGSFPPADREIKRFGFDISRENILRARKIFPHVTFLEHDFTEVNLRVDLVILSDIVEHVPDDVGFLRSVVRLSDAVVLHLPLEKCWANRGRNYGPGDFAGHLRAYDEMDAERLIRAAGLKLVEKRIAWFVDQPCYREHTLLRWSEDCSAVKSVKHLLHDVVLKSRKLRRAYFPRHLFCFLRKSEDYREASSARS